MSTDHFALNRVVTKIMGKEIERLGITKNKFRKKTGLKQAYFVQLTNYTAKYGKPMSDEIALKILVACDIRQSEAEKIIAEVKAEEALKPLPPKARKEVIQKITGSNNIQIYGDNNHIQK